MKVPKIYPLKFRDKTIQLVQEGNSLKKTSKIMGCKYQTISNWCKQRGISVAHNCGWNRIDELKIQKIIELAPTHSKKEIASALGISRWTVSNYCKKYGLKTPESRSAVRLLESEKKEILDLVRSGESYHAVAKKFNRNIMTIYKVCQKAGIKSDYPSPWQMHNKLAQGLSQDFAIDGCSFKMNPKWIWMTIAEVELNELVMRKPDPPDEAGICHRVFAHDNKNGYCLNPEKAHIEGRWVKDAFSFQGWLFHKPPGEEIDNFESLAIDKLFELREEMSKKNRHKYFKLVHAKPLSSYPRFKKDG